jgi:hypothetical protein
MTFTVELLNDELDAALNRHAQHDADDHRFAYTWRAV